MTNALALIRQWSDLPAPTLDDLVGTWKAEFVPPLRHIAPVGLGLIGLPRWYGKRFMKQGAGGLSGINLVRSRGTEELRETLPMEATHGHSNADGRPAIVVSYASTAPRPWRWVRDEFRILPGGSWLGLSFATVAPVRRMGLPGLPFLISRVD